MDRSRGGPPAADRYVSLQESHGRVDAEKSATPRERDGAERTDAEGSRQEQRDEQARAAAEEHARRLADPRTDRDYAALAVAVRTAERSPEFLDQVRDDRRADLEREAAARDPAERRRHVHDGVQRHEATLHRSMREDEAQQKLQAWHDKRTAQQRLDEAPAQERGGYRSYAAEIDRPKQREGTPREIGDHGREQQARTENREQSDRQQRTAQLTHDRERELERERS